jgi:branched-chain amino acid aminotransferase
MPFFMKQFFTYNGELFPAGTPVFPHSCRAFRFGDSLFETIRFNNGGLLLLDFHIERLLKGMRLLGIEPGDIINPKFLESAILELADKNDIRRHGRVRITVFRKESGLSEPISCIPEWLIECNSLPEHYFGLNKKGYTIDIASENRKASGPLSNMKSGNYLIYILAAEMANKLRVNECLVLNDAGRIADSSIFNVFLIKNNVVYTPSLSEAPVEGVMRRHILTYFQTEGNPVQETAITIGDLQSADEVFLTNALFGLRWVESFQSSRYSNTITSNIYSDLFQQYIT